MNLGYGLWLKNQIAFRNTIAALQPPNPDAVFRHVLYTPVCNALLTAGGCVVPGSLNPGVGKIIFSFSE